MIFKGNGASGDTVAGVSVTVTLSPNDTAATGAFDYPIYMRFRIDTLLRGTLPMKLFWAKGYRAGSIGCPDANVGKVQFLSASAGLARMRDLKIPFKSGFRYGIFPLPDAEWFDGRYLVSPGFPGLKIDIREVLPGYPVAIRGRRGDKSGIQIPLRAPARGYRPDGRSVPGSQNRTSPVPLLK